MSFLDKLKNQILLLFYVDDPFDNTVSFNCDISLLRVVNPPKNLFTAYSIEERLLFTSLLLTVVLSSCFDCCLVLAVSILSR